MEVIKFQVGQRVATPKGEGAIKSINGDKIEVALDSGSVASFGKGEVSDDSDAG
jgi:hypothetical protein